MNLLLSFTINPESLTMYLDYALYGLIGLVALAFIVGFIRGIWNEGFRLLFVGLLILGAVLFTRDLVNFAMNTDISDFAQSAGLSSISFAVGEVPIIVPITTAFETIENILEQTLISFGIFITPQISQLIIGLTLVLIRYVTFILLAVLIFLLGETLAAILYFIPFRFFIPRLWREKAKLRLLGGLAGSTKMVLILAMFLSPFTSLINTVNNAFKDFDSRYGNQITSELYQSIMGYVNAYDNSAFASTLFQWYVSEDGKTFDTILMDFVTGEDIENYRLTLSDELDSLVEIAASVIATGAVDSTFTTIDTSLLISESFVTNLITGLTGSNLVMAIIPIAIQLAANIDEVTNYIDPANIDFEAVNWREELVKIGDILNGVIRSGVIDTVLSGNISLDTLLPALFSPQAGPEIIGLLNLIDETQFLSQVFPAVLYGLVQQELTNGVPPGTVGLSAFLPTVWADYQSIRFGNELAIIYELMYELINEADGLLDVLLDSLTPEGLLDPIMAKKAINGSPTIASVVRDNFQLITEILIGQVNADGFAINNSPSTGKSINRVALLDSDIIMRGLPVVFEEIVLPTLSGIAGENFDNSDLAALINEFNTGTQGQIRLNYKSELAGLLSIVNAVLNNATLIDLIDNPDQGSIDVLSLLEDSQFRRQLKTDIVPKLDRSELISTIIPGFLESTFSDPSFNDFLELIGITVDDLNFNFDSVSRELNIVIDLLGYAVGILDVSDDLFNQFPNVYLDLIGLLDSIYMSDIINLNPVTNDKSTNYRSIIKGLFSSVEGIGISESDVDLGIDRIIATGNNWTTVYTDVNDNGMLDAQDIINVVQSGENYHLINFLKTAITSGLLDISGDLFTALNDLATGSEDLDDPNVSPLYQIFAFADRSQIIYHAFGGLLDELFGETGGILDSSLGTSFRNVLSWTEEGSTLVYLVKQLVNFQNGLEGLDFLNSDVTIVEELLQGLAASQIFITQDGQYLFPDFLLNQLKGISDISTYLSDPNPYVSLYDDDPLDPYTIITQDFYSIGNTASTKENWFGVKTLIVDGLNEPILDDDGFLQYQYIGGEIEYIVGFIAALQEVSIDDLTGGGSLSGETISDVLFALNDAVSLRVLIFNVYDEIFGTSSLDIGSLTMSQTNTYVFLELNQAQRAEQIQATVDLLDTIDSMGLSGGGSFDIANFTEETIDTVGELLTILHDSKLFNSYKLGFTRANGDLTVFEQTYKFLLTTSTLDTFIYDESLSDAQRDEALTDDLLGLTNNFGTSSEDSWNGPEGEIQKFVNIMTAFVRTDIDFTNFGGSSISDLLNTLEGLEKVENLLLSMNDSLIVSPAIGNLFGSIFDSDSFNINGLNMSDSHTAFFNNEPNKETRGVEISLILDIYWDINSIGLTGGVAFTPDLIDSELFSGLLNKMHDSQVFNTFKDGNSYVLGDLTIFEQTIRMILNTSTLDTFIYPDAPLNTERLDLLQADIASIDNNFGQVETDDGWTGNQGEINRIIQILERFKETDIDFNSFDSNSMSTLLGGPGGVSKIENLLLAINESTLVYPALPNLFDDIFGTPSFNLDGVNLSEANTGFFRTEIVIDTRAEEISLLMDIYENINAVGLNTGALTASSIDGEAIESLLRNLHTSYVFNTFKDGYSYVLEDLTVFEQTIFMILDTSQLAAYIYEGELNPQLLLRIDIIAVINNQAQTRAVVDGWAATNGEIDKIIGILNAFKATDLDFSSFAGTGSNDAISDLTETDEGTANVENLLLAMNASKIVYPAIPNLFANMLSSGDVSNIGIDFASANTKYRGNRNDPLNLQLGDEFLPYQDEEITGLIEIFKAVKDVATKDFSSLNNLTNDDLDNMQFLVEDLYYSNIFHQTGPASGVNSDPTVFQQMVIKMMIDTRVADLIYDTDNPNPAYINQFFNKEEKAAFLVMNYEALYPSTNTTHFTYRWVTEDNVEGELTRFFRIFKELKATLPTVGNLDGIDVGNISPSGISRIMSVMAYSNLASDAVPGLLKDAFNFISFGTYTEGNENYYLSPKDYFISDLNSMDYSLPTPAVIQEGVIGQVLGNFYNEDTNVYLDLGENFNMKTYLDDGNSTFAIIDLLARSEIFGNDATVINDPNALALGEQPVSLDIKTRALTFYNLLAGSGVTKYFNYLTTTTDQKEAKVARVEAIFAGDFDVPFEAERLDGFISVLSEFTDLEDASTLDQYSEEMRSLIELTYTATGYTITDRAYMVSELSAGFFTDIFDSEYERVNDTDAPFFNDAANLSKRINFYDADPLDGIDNDFNNLNPYEADGMEGALLYLNVIAGISDDYNASGFNPAFNPGSERIESLKEALVKMGSLANTQVTGGPFGPLNDVGDYDYSNWTSLGNSLIAKLFYASRVVNASGFTFFNQLIENRALFIDPLFPVSLSTTPYATQFVFEIEGEKIEYIFA
jgi:hypothetical protein